MVSLQDSPAQAEFYSCTGIPKMAIANRAQLTASGTVQTNGTYYYGYIVTTALGLGAVTIYDNTAASGTVLDVIPQSSAVGTKNLLPIPIPCTNGIYASFASTGGVLFLFGSV